MNSKTIKYEFVNAIPEHLEDDTIYIAMEFATAVHKCICGCGQEVVTPLSPTDWQVTYDGVSVSLSPSIGNWSFPCQSHYWIVRNSVRWAASWSPEKIEAGRAADRRAKQDYHRNEMEPTSPPMESRSQGLFSRIWRWLSNS